MEVQPTPILKPWYMSKTFWASIASVLLPMIPPVGAFRTQNQTAYDALQGLLFGVVLRTSTKSPISWSIG